MTRYLLRRLAFLGLTFLLTSLIVFGVTQLLPGDVARVILGREASEAALQALRAQLGLDQPLPMQYLRWLGRFVTGDWGTSYSTGLPIPSLPGYCDQPSVVRLPDGVWLCVMTTGPVTDRT